MIFRQIDLSEDCVARHRRRRKTEIDSVTRVANQPDFLFIGTSILIQLAHFDPEAVGQSIMI